MLAYRLPDAHMSCETAKQALIPAVEAARLFD